MVQTSSRPSGWPNAKWTQTAGRPPGARGRGQPCGAGPSAALLIGRLRSGREEDERAIQVAERARDEGPLDPIKRPGVAAPTQPQQQDPKRPRLGPEADADVIPISPEGAMHPPGARQQQQQQQGVAHLQSFAFKGNGEH